MPSPAPETKPDTACTECGVDDGWLTADNVCEHCAEDWRLLDEESDWAASDLD